MKSQKKTAKLLDKATALHRAGDLRQAVDLYRRYLRHNPDNAEVLHTLGGLYYQIRDFQSAGISLEKAQRLAPERLDYLSDLGAFRLTSGEYQSAVESLSQLTQQAPDNPQGHYNLGLALHGAGRLPEAIDSFEQAARLQPDYAAAHYNLGTIFQELGNYRQAEESLQRAVQYGPELVQAHIKLGEILISQHRYEAAYDAFQKAHTLDRDNTGIIINMAEALRKTGRTEEGIKLLQDALLGQPQEISLLVALGKLLDTSGQIDTAEGVYRKALALQQDASKACLGFSGIRKFNHNDADIIKQMELILENKHLQEFDRQNVCFALGKIYDDCNEYDKAFEYYRIANTIQRREQEYDRKVEEQFVDDTISIFTSSIFAEFSSLGTNMERPIFIVGMPRSGTTLTEQILVSHPEVAYGGELLYFNSISKNLSHLLNTELAYPLCCKLLNADQAAKIIRHYLELLDRYSNTARFVTDKLPTNYKSLGLIRLLFPRAPIIHCRRDPLDVCLSIYFQSFSGFHSYAYDLMDIGHRYLQYSRLMAHWRKVLPGPFMEHRYDDLVTHQEEQSRILIKFCGLDWDDSCLEFYRKKRDIDTASNWQVRQPIYSGSVNRWKNYEKYLAPLMKLFAEARDEL